MEAPVRSEHKAHEPRRYYASRECLLAMRGHVKTWEGVMRIYATYQVDPGGQGQKLIKHTPGAAWRCGHCGHQSDTFSLLSPSWPPKRCRKCRLTNTLERVEATLYFLANRPKGARNVFVDPYSVTAFVIALKIWLGGTFRSWPALGFFDKWCLGLSERELAASFGKSRYWVRCRQDDLSGEYES